MFEDQATGEIGGTNNALTLTQVVSFEKPITFGSRHIKHGSNI